MVSHEIGGQPQFVPQAVGRGITVGERFRDQ